MLHQVKACPIRTAHTLHPALQRNADTSTFTIQPYIGGMTLCVPAVLSVVGHLVAHVLPEPQLIRCHAHSHQKLLNTTQEIAQGLISNHTLPKLIKQIVDPVHQYTPLVYPYLTRPSNLVMIIIETYQLDSFLQCHLTRRASFHLITCRVESKWKRRN